MQNAYEYWESHFKTTETDPCYTSPEHATCLERFQKDYLHERSRILDLACGSGRNARYLAQQGGDVYGVDFTRAAITACVRSFQNQSLKGAFIQAGIDAIPFCNDHFDAAICVAALDHVTVDCAQKALFEMRRVTTGKGMILLTFDHPQTDDDKLEQAEVLQDGTLLFVRGEYQGMLFRRYQDSEIVQLVGKEDVISFEYGKKGSRIIVCR